MENDSSDTSTDGILEKLEEAENLESWVEWIQRTTREATDATKKVGVEDCEEEQRRSLWKWAGHTARRDDGRWAFKVLMCTPSCQRSQSRPKSRWEDVLTEYASRMSGDTQWYHVAGDRDRWRRYEDSFAKNET